MTRQEIAELICRTAALLGLMAAAFFFIVGAAEFALAFRMHGMWDSGEDFWQYFSDPTNNLISGVGCSAVASLVWLLSEDIGARLVRDNPKPVTHGDWTTADVLSVILAGLGAFQLLNGVHGVIALLSSPVFYYELSEKFIVRTEQFVAPVAQIVAGILFLIGWSGIVRAVHWLRTAGTPLTDPSPAASDRLSEPSSPGRGTTES